MKRLLFLSRWLPYPPNNGSKLRIYNLLKGLCQHYDITLLTFMDPIERDWDLTPLKQLCSNVETVIWNEYRPSSSSAIAGFASSKPRYLVDTFSQEMKEQVQHQVATQDFQVVLASQVDTAVYREFFGNVPSLFEEVELASFFEKYTLAGSLRQRARFFVTWTKHRRFLSRLLNLYDACTVVSELEKQLVIEAAPSYRSVEIIPNCVDLESYRHAEPPLNVKNQLIFTGSFGYRVNYEAILWFIEEIFPRIRREIPDSTLVITGDHKDLPLPDLCNVKLVGFIEDVRPKVSESMVSIAPIREGGGTRLKILEAMALHTPVVTTSKGSEGLDVQHMVHLLIADTAETFAEYVIRLLNDSALRSKLTNNAYKLVAEHYNWEMIMPNFVALIDRLATPQ